MHVEVSSAAATLHAESDTEQVIFRQPVPVDVRTVLQLLVQRVRDSNARRRCLACCANWTLACPVLGLWQTRRTLQFSPAGRTRRRSLAHCACRTLACSVLGLWQTRRTLQLGPVGRTRHLWAHSIAIVRRKQYDFDYEYNAESRPAGPDPPARVHAVRNQIRERCF